MGKMIEDNLRLAFFWPFILLIGLVVIGFAYQELTPFLKILILTTAAFTLYETINFLTYERFKYIALD